MDAGVRRGVGTKGMRGNRPLYRLPEVIAGPDPIFVVEGEKGCRDRAPDVP